MRTCKQLAVLVAIVLLGPSLLLAQTRIEAGVFLDYLGISQTKTTNLGLGARFGYGLHRNIMLEGELAYDYGVNFDEAYVNVVTGNVAAIARTSVGVTHFLVGPKFQPRGRFRPFATIKTGVTAFRLSPSLLPFSNEVSAILGLRTSNLNLAVYPGGGIEAAIGPVGLRLEFGDEIYFNSGAHNNLRFTFGPILRF